MAADWLKNLTSLKIFSSRTPSKILSVDLVSYQRGPLRLIMQRLVFQHYLKFLTEVAMELLEHYFKVLIYI
jgi:hypothetical protein